jgi:cyclophilin family peptidyl-prolyl cis-trans isomerase
VAGLALVMSGCGGGGGGGDAPTPTPKATVSSVTAGTPKYGQPLVFTVNGTLLDSTVTATTSACTGLQRSTTAPNVSTATQAFYTCTATTTGDSTLVVTDPAQAGALFTLNYTVPQPQVTMTVSNGAGVSGNLVFTLDPNKVKLTVDNFLQYVNDGFYPGTVFHRIVSGFVVQGGGYLPLAPGATPVLKATRAPIALEVGRGLSNTTHTLAMARSAAANSATSQFFVNLADNSGGLDPSAASAGYAVFGVLSSGLDVLGAITAAPCAPVSGVSECAPNPNVSITAAAQSR